MDASGRSGGCAAWYASIGVSSKELDLTGTQRMVTPALFAASRMEGSSLSVINFDARKLGLTSRTATLADSNACVMSYLQFAPALILVSSQTLIFAFLTYGSS